MKRIAFFTSVLIASLSAASAGAQTLPQTFDMTAPQPVYSDSLGYGYDFFPAPEKDGDSPFYFSVKVPDGNYQVSLTLGSKKRAAATVVRAESRRLLVENCQTGKGEYKTYTFTVSKFSSYIDGEKEIPVRRPDRLYLNWDDRLTLEFNGPDPAVKSISINPDTTAMTVFLCGNSTVVDQNYEPWSSWGQMIPRWFDERVAICNLAESGLSATTFLRGNRLDKVLSMMKPGDYVFCEFGHNDQKERAPGSGAWYNFQYNLKQFVDRVREKGGNIVFVTPTQRRNFDESHQHIVETHGDYPDAMRDVARREKAPVIELHDMTRTFFETLGYEGSKKSLVHYKAGELPGIDKDIEDNTHFNPYGAYEVAKMVVMGMKGLDLPMVKFLRPEWKDFDPAHPDDYSTFVWYPSPINDGDRPAGN